MYLFDTNMFSFAVRRNENVVKRIVATPYTDIYISGIAVEETLAGFFEELSRGRTSKKNVDFEACYQSLFRSMKELMSYQLLPFTNQDEAVYQAIKTKSANVTGPGDWRVAAQGINRKMVVVTNNERDFLRIQRYAPELRFVDWTKESL